MELFNRIKHLNINHGQIVTTSKPLILGKYNLRPKLFTGKCSNCNTINTIKLVKKI
jgi:hypothetical protein